MGEYEPSVEVRPATEDDHMAVRRLVDAALLVVEELPARLADDDVLVAVPAERDGSVLGTVVLVPPSVASGGDRNASASISGGASERRDAPAAADAVEIEAIAVRRARRGQRIGTALVDAVADRHDVVVADFDANLRPFYEALGFEIRTIGEDRLRGRLQAHDA